jgi:hypothetical protein
MVWLRTNFPDSPTKTSFLKHLDNLNMVLLDKWFKKKGDKITFYVHVYDKMKKTNYCQHITLAPNSPAANVISNKIPR